MLVACVIVCTGFCRCLVLELPTPGFQLLNGQRKGWSVTKDYSKEDLAALEGGR